MLEKHLGRGGEGRGGEEEFPAVWIYTVMSWTVGELLDSLCYQNERPGRTVDIEAKGSQGDRWFVYLHAIYGHLVLELIDIGAGGVCM